LFCWLLSGTKSGNENPPALLANRQTKHAREVCCDLSVAGVLENNKGGYWLTLINAARRLLTKSAAPALGLVGVFEEPFRIVKRIKWLEQDMSTTKYMISLSLFFLATFVILFALQLSPQMGSESAAPIPRTAASTGGGQAQTTGVVPEGKYVLIKDATYERTYAGGIEVASRLISTDETWINGKLVVMKAPGNRTIVDLEENTYVFINDAKKTFVRKAIPLDTSDIYANDIKDWFDKLEISGAVEETGATKEILGYECREYRLTRWGRTRDGEIDRQTMSIWVANDLPVSSHALDVALDNRRKLQGGSEQLREEMRKLSGFQLYIDFNPDIGDNGKKMVSITTEIKMLDAPEGLLEIPEDYTENTTFSGADF
jgi:hypothetical protein